MNNQKTVCSTNYYNTAFSQAFFKPQQWPTRIYQWPVLICKFTKQVYGQTHTQFLFIYLLSPRSTKLWRGYRVCPVRMYVSTYVSTYVRPFVCSPALATSFIIQFQYNFTQVLDMTIPRTGSRFSVIGSRSRSQ